MDDDIFQFEAAPETAPELVLGKKKKKKKKKPKENDGSGAAVPVAEDHEASVLERETKNKKKENTSENGDATPSSAFAALGLDEDGDDSDKAPVPSSAFAALGFDSDDGDNGLENDDPDTYNEDKAVAAPVLGKKKKRKKKKDLVLPDPADDVHPADVNASGSAVDTDKVDDDEIVATPMLPSKKKKKKKKQLDLEQPTADEEPEQELEPEPEPVELKRPMTAAEKKKAKKERERQAKLEKAKREDDELNAILAELGDSKPGDQPGESVDAQNGGDAPDGTPMTAAQKKRAKKKKKAEAEKDDAGEMDALLAELGGPELSAKPVQSVDAAAGGVDDLLAELAGGDTPAAKKKVKRKKKKGAANGDEDGGDAAIEGTSAASAAEPKKPKKKESAAVRKMREHREKTLAEEERLRKIAEEEEAKVAEEERQRMEEAKRKEEEKARKKAAEKAKRERKRKEGTLLSKAEKERRKKAEKYRQQVMDSGMIAAAAGSSASDQPEKPARIVYDRKKRHPKSKPQDQIEPKDTSKIEEKSLPVEEKVADKAEAPPQEPEMVPDAWDDLPDPEQGEKQKDETAKPNEAGRDEDAVDQGESEEEEESDDSDDSEYEGMTKAEIAAEKRVGGIRRERGKQKAKAMAARTADDLRSPVICILGHVDTGKTKILDRIRKTNVQDGEAGGITQQIGATYFPIDAVKKEATKLQEGKKLNYNIPSLLIIDTPGHESFTNLRSRGSSLCDIAILVIDIMHGLEPQTRESIDLLKLRKTPFVVALNKIDRIYGWDPQPHNCPTRESLAKQPAHAREEFKQRVRETKLQLAEIGFNTELYWENQDVRKTVSVVPTSAISGEGIPDLLMLLLALPQKLLTERLMFSAILEATVLEVKVIEGLGTTIDIVLTGGTIREGDTIMVVGLDGPIVTTIRALLTPHPMKEMRVKGQYLHHKKIKAAQGIKISADGLEKAVAGTQVMVVDDPNNEDEMEYVREEVMKDFQTILTNVDRSGLGVYVQASTLGSLEALLEFLRTSKIPVSGINIGPVHKRDVTKASTMLEKRKEFATVLAFDVLVEKEARELAEDTGVKIFTADIIYHLFDQFTAYMEHMKKERREQVNDDVVFPSICKILPQHVYNKKDPIVLGVDVMEGILRVGTPLVVKHGNGWLDIGRVASLELNKKQVITARKGESVAVKIQDKNTEHIMYGRHFDFQNAIVSKMSRSAIDLLKENFRDDLEKEDWKLVVKLKKMFDIM